MSRRIHFLSLAPPGLVDDIVESFRLAAHELGHVTTFAHYTVLPGMLNIVFFCWRAHWEAISALHPQCIVVNFEHMSDGATWFLPAYRDILTKCYLWEYSETNFHRHRELNFRAADYVPLGYQEHAAPELALVDALSEEERDIDVLFFGALTPRRQLILAQLIARGVRIDTPTENPWTVAERDERLRRAKVVLNLHQFDDSRIVETPRLSILFRNRKAVVCELYVDSELTPLWRDAVVGVPYDRLVDATLALLEDPVRRAELETLGYQRLGWMAQKPIVAAALERFDQWADQQRDVSIEHLLGGDDSKITAALIVQDTKDLLITIESLLLQQQHVDVDVLLITCGVTLSESETQALNKLRHLSRLEMPSSTDMATVRNLSLAQTRGDYLVFIECGDTAMPERLKHQIQFLNAHLNIDVVGSWLGDTGLSTSLHKTPELDHEIKAEFLESQGGLALQTCMFRTHFLQHTGVRFDAQFDAHNNAHFLYRCAAVNARFAVIPIALCDWHASANAPSVVIPSNIEWLVTHARRELLEAFFPTLTAHEVGRLCELYAMQWPVDLHFASDLLDLMAKAGESPAEELNLVASTVRRALRHEAVRLIRIYSNITQNDPTWLAAQFASPAKAFLLAPAQGELRTHAFDS